jgi:hypothetical protein
MEFYSATKKNEIFLFAGKWMELENIILSEVSQAQKAKSCMFSHICVIIDLIQRQNTGHTKQRSYERGRVKEGN